MRRDLRLLRSAGAGCLLDVGCGNGSFLARCRAAGIVAHGIEPVAAAAAVARRQGAPVLLATGTALPFDEHSFGAVRMKEVLEHVPDPLALAREARRALAPGGLLLVYVPSQWSLLYPFPANFWDDYTHLRAFSRTGVSRLLEDAGFERARVQGYTPPLRWWQAPVSAAASRLFPFLWRATAAAPPSEEEDCA